MRITVHPRQIQATPADALIVNLCEGVSVPGGAAGAVDTALGSTDGFIDWFEPKPAWQAQYEDPDPARLHAAGFDYVYIDAGYWQILTVEQRERFDQACVQLLEEYSGPFGPQDYRIDFRRLYAVRIARAPPPSI